MKHLSMSTRRHYGHYVTMPGENGGRQTTRENQLLTSFLFLLITVSAWLLLSSRP